MNNQDQRTLLLVEDEALIAMTQKMDLENYIYKLPSGEIVAIYNVSPRLNCWNVNCRRRNRY
jgi:hypothetical protein